MPKTHTQGTLFFPADGQGSFASVIVWQILLFILYKVKETTFPVQLGELPPFTPLLIPKSALRMAKSNFKELNPIANRRLALLGGSCSLPSEELLQKLNEDVCTLRFSAIEFVASVM